MGADVDLFIKNHCVLFGMSSSSDQWCTEDWEYSATHIIAHSSNISCRIASMSSVYFFPMIESFGSDFPASLFTVVSFGTFLRPKYHISCAQPLWNIIWIFNEIFNYCYLLFHHVAPHTDKLHHVYSKIWSFRIVSAIQGKKCCTIEILHFLWDTLCVSLVRFCTLFVAYT